LEILFVQHVVLENIIMFLDIIAVQETQLFNNNKQKLKELTIMVNKNLC
jgi:hypothetical protein